MDTRAVSTISLLFTPFSFTPINVLYMTIQVIYSYLHLYLLLLCYYYCITFNLLICVFGVLYILR